jgi:endo-1,4-beta-xylanase
MILAAMLPKIFLFVLASSGAVSAQLHSLAVRAGLEYFGTAVDERRTSDTQYRAIYSNTQEFGQLVPENGQKWQNTQPSRGSFSYSQGDIVSSTRHRVDSLLL